MKDLGIMWQNTYKVCVQKKKQNTDEIKDDLNKWRYTIFMNWMTQYVLSILTM